MTLRCLNQASHFGFKCIAYFLPLSEFLARACEEYSPVSPDFAALALRGLDEGLDSSFEQFARISLLLLSSKTPSALAWLYLQGLMASLVDLIPIAEKPIAGPSTMPCGSGKADEERCGG